MSKFGSELDGDILVLCEGGVRPVRDLDAGARVWNGRGWGVARAVKLGSRPRFAIAFTDGSRLNCGAGQQWGVLAGRRLEVRPTSMLCPGDLLFPFNLPEICRRRGRPKRLQAAHAAGAEFASTGFVPMRALNYELGAIEQFLLGVFGSKRALAGGRASIAKLAAIFARAGLRTRAIQVTPSAFKLALADTHLVDMPLLAALHPQAFTCCSSGPLKILSVDRAGSFTPYSIEFFDPASRSLVAGGALALAGAATVPAPKLPAVLAAHSPASQAGTVPGRRGRRPMPLAKAVSAV